MPAGIYPIRVCGKDCLFANTHCEKFSPKCLRKAYDKKQGLSYTVWMYSAFREGQRWQKAKGRKRK